MAGLGARVFGDWNGTFKTLTNAHRDIRDAKKRAILKEAEFFRTQIVLGIQAQAPGGVAFKPLSPATIALRQFLGFKGTKALIERGDLVRNVKVTDLGEEAFVGILRTAKTADGKSLADIAELNENGSKPIVVPMTPKMAALLHAAFKAAGIERDTAHAPGRGVIVVQVPARPFLGPVFLLYGAEEVASKRFAERFVKEMRAGNPMWHAAADVL